MPGGDRMIRKVEICGINTSELEVLKKNEKYDLLVRAKEGNIFAREKYIKGNLKLVLSVVKRFNNRGENLDDLFQVGCIGLIKAIDNFDLSQDVKFSTYAVPMIIGEIKRYLRDNSSIRVSRSLKDIAYKTYKIKEEFINKNMEEPTIEYIAKEIGVAKEEVVFALESIQDTVSLYEPIYNDGGDAIYVVDQVKDEKNLAENWIDSLALRESIKKLKGREKNIITLRFFKGKTQMEVADEIGISQAQVSRLEKNALDKIKRNIS